MIRRPPRSTLFPTRRSSDLRSMMAILADTGWTATRCQTIHPQAADRAVEAIEQRRPVRTVRYAAERSEEHTSELQSRQYLVCRLLLEKKKKNDNYFFTSDDT